MALMPISEIKCPVDIADFPQYTGFEQYKQIVAVQVPVVYDQCLITRCIMDKNDPRITTNPADPKPCPKTQKTVDGLSASIPIDTSKPVTFREFRCFQVKIKSITSSQVCNTQKSIKIAYSITCVADILNGCSNKEVSIPELELTDTVVLNVPESLSQISTSTGGTGTTDKDEPLYKLELLPDLDSCCAYFVPETGNKVKAYFNLCYRLVVKCELDAQILVPTYGFFENGRECQSPLDECPCSKCPSSTVPVFYPPIDFSVFECGIV